MIEPTQLHPTPAWRSVAAEQFRAVGTAIQGPVAVAGALVVTGATLLAVLAMRYGEGIAVGPEFAFVVALAAPLLPIAVWKGEYRCRRSYLASLPVDPTRHALVKVAAGWAWLMVLVGAFTLLMLALAAVTGGGMGVHSGNALTDVASDPSRPEPAATGPQVTMPIWQWAVFFTSATVMYLFGSAVVLAARRARWRLAGVAIGCVFVVIADAEGIGLGSTSGRLETVISVIWGGRYGLRTLILGTGGPADFTAAAGRSAAAWHARTVAVWAATTVFWLATAVAAAAAVIVVPGDRKN